MEEEFKNFLHPLVKQYLVFAAIKWLLRNCLKIFLNLTRNFLLLITVDMARHIRQKKVKILSLGQEFAITGQDFAITGQDFVITGQEFAITGHELRSYIKNELLQSLNGIKYKENIVSCPWGGT